MTPQTLRSLGIAYLVMGDIGRAVPVLEEAADQTAPAAPVLSDLAAAYLARAIRNNQAQDLQKALATADRATKADPRMAEAWFNLAYALERLSLADQARAAWQEYLTIDDQSGWAAEARAHLRTLSAAPQSRGRIGELEQIDAATRGKDGAEVRKLVRLSPDAARDFVPGSTPACVAGRRTKRTPQEATEALAASLSVAGHLTDAIGDRFLIDATEAARSASRSAVLATALARAHETFHGASDDYNQDRIRESVVQFEAALEPLTVGGSPFAEWTRLYLAIGRYYAGDHPGAFHLLDPLMKNSEARAHTRLLGLAHRLRGLIHVVAGQFAAGLEEYRAAVVCFERVRDIDNAASMHALVAEDLDFLGETEMAWTELAKALAQLAHIREHRHRHTILQDSALASLRQGFPAAALYFQRATLDNATRWGRPLAIFNAHMYQGEIQRQVGNPERALAELRDARQVLSRISDPQLVARDEAQIQLAQGEVEWRTRPDAAVESLSKALDLFQRSRTNWPLLRVLLARGRAHLTAGREDLAEADFTQGIDIFEAQRASVANDALRSASFERPWDLYTEMIRFQAVNRRRPERALAVAERGRARTLLEAVSPASGALPVDPVVARVNLPADVAMLYYAALDDRLLIWTLTRTQLDFVDTPVRHAELAHLLEQFRSEQTGLPGAARDMPSLTRLYDVLIRPVAGNLPAGSQVVVVPDGVLHAIPFAALLRREDRRYLVEDRAVQVTPSLTMFLAASAKHEPLTAPRNNALVMGNPRADGDSEGAMPDLPEAEAEARDVAALYPTSSLLLGAQATKSSFVESAGRHAVVHFAGHAIANDARPELSRLLMAGPDETARSLFARDIAAQSFPATQLVVLGACRTSAGRIRRGEGVFHLARPFLAAGVRTVVASLWDVNDRASRRLLVAFHRALQQSGDVADALRRSQIALMGDADPSLQTPAAWAAFTVIGGRAPARSAHASDANSVKEND